MATAASVTVDLTTCPICLSLFGNPKSLPCLHTFCLKCLQGYFKGKCPGDKAPCPMCRKEFQIPPEGLDGLQHHFFVQQLVDVRKASSEEFDEVACEVCQEENDEDVDSVPLATAYCVNCSQKLCEQCVRPHRRWKGGAHLVKPLVAEVEQELIQLRASACDKHPDKQVELYCCDCDENICLMCSAVKHRSHNSLEIPEAADSFRPGIDADAKKVLASINSAHRQMEISRQDAAEVRVKVDDTKKLIVSTGDQLKRSVDNQISDLMMELESVTSESDKQASSVEETYQLALVSMESFHTYSRELLDKGRPSDVTRAACQLDDRANELLNDDATAVKYRPPHVTFTPADVTRLNLIGKVTVTSASQQGNEPLLPPVLLVETEREKELAQQLRQAKDRERQLQMELDRMKGDASQSQTEQEESDDTEESSADVSGPEMENRTMGHVIMTLAEGEPIRGVATLGKHHYVLRGPKSSEQIEVYDITTFRLLNRVSVPGLGDASDIVACKHYCCAYTCGTSSQYVYRMSSINYNELTQWSVNDGPTCLSITIKYSVLVTCRKVRKMKEFTTDGRLLRQVVLCVPSPWHTVQLSGGDLMVCHGHTGEPLHRVCLMNSGGQVIKSFYGGNKGSSSSQMNTPCHMAVDENESVFVVDRNNCAVLLLSPALRDVRKAVSSDKLKWTPYRLCLDAERRRLYVAVNERLKVGDFTAGRVIVVNV